MKKQQLIDWFFVAALILASPFFFFPSIDFISVFLIIPFFLLARFIGQGQFLEKTPLDLPLAILLVQIFINCLIVPDLAFSLPKIAGALFGIIFFYALVGVLADEKTIFLGMLAFVTMGMVLAIGGVIGMAWSFESLFSRMQPVFSRVFPRINYRLPGAEAGINPNPLGGTILWFIPLTFVLLFSFASGEMDSFSSKRKKPLFLFFLLSFYSMLTALFLTQSVGSWMGLTLTLFFFLFVKKSWKRRIVVAVVFLFFIFLLSGTWAVAPKKNPASGNFFQHKIETRFSQWKAGLETVKDHPFSGIGMNRLRLHPSIGYEGAHAHNHLLHIAAELGIPALIAYLAILIVIGYICWKVWVEAKTGWIKASAFGLGAGQLAHFFFGLTDSIPLGAKPGIFFWISLALVTALYNLLRKQKLGPGKGEGRIL